MNLTLSTQQKLLVIALIVLTLIAVCLIAVTAVAHVDIWHLFESGKAIMPTHP